MRILVYCLAITISHYNLAAQSAFGQQDTNVLTAASKIAPSIVRFETIGGMERVDGTIVNSGPSTGVIVSTDGYAISAAINFALCRPCCSGVLWGQI